MLQNQSAASGHLGFISVMATENNTIVDFDLQDGVQTTGGQNDHSVTLNKFQSYFITNSDNLNSLLWLTKINNLNRVDRGCRG